MRWVMCSRVVRRWRGPGRELVSARRWLPGVLMVGSLLLGGPAAAAWAQSGGGADPVTAASLPPDAASLDVVEILRKADNARGNLEGLSWTLDLTSVEGDRTSEMTVEVKTRGYDFLSETRSPAKYKGQKLLLVSGNMWFHKPGLSKPVPIAPRQRLMGQAAYGDIAATNYAEDYEGEIVGEESVDGESCLVFALKARERNATYDRVRYRVSRERGVGVRAEYFTVSGKLIKSARMEYQEITTTAGATQLFVTTIVITDAIMRDNVTTLVFRDPRFGEIPDRVFNVNLLR